MKYFFFSVFVSFAMPCCFNSRSADHVAVLLSERPKECLCGSFSLDLDAVHSTVPKMLPWEFPCKLSETLCMEVDKTILLAEEKKKQMEISDLEGLQLHVTAP